MTYLFYRKLLFHIYYSTFHILGSPIISKALLVRLWHNQMEKTRKEKNVALDETIVLGLLIQYFTVYTSDSVDYGMCLLLGRPLVDIVRLYEQLRLLIENLVLLDRPQTSSFFQR